VPISPSSVPGLHSSSRTQLIHHVCGSIKPFGVRLPASPTLTFPRKAAWKIPRELRPALVPSPGDCACLHGLAGPITGILDPDLTPFRPVSHPLS